MNARVAAILVVLLVVLGGGALLYYNQERARRPQNVATLGRTLLQDLRIADVASIRIVEPKSALTVQRRDEGWTIAERDGFPADLARVREFVLKLAALKVGQSEPIGDKDRATVEPLLDLKIKTPAGQLVPVSTFTHIETSTAPRTLNRFQQRNAVRIFGGVKPGVTKAEGLRVLEAAAATAGGPPVVLDYAGESRQIRQEGGALTVTLGFAVVLIYLVLAAQFQSFRDPLIVLLGSVPLAISGALVFSFLDLTTINIYSQVGLITLVGLIAKNGILIVEFANQLQASGRARVAAVREAALTRLRPVLMTSAATVFGHLPLVLATGPGAAARNSIGMVLVTGMTVGTLFTLFVVPVFYSLIAAEHQPDSVGDNLEDLVEDDELLVAGVKA